MKALILAAGYATRLYPLTKDTPKSLLILNSKPIIDHILDKIELVRNVDQIYIVTNNKFYPQFDAWLHSKLGQYSLKYKLINDGSNDLNDKLGAIGDINLAIAKERIKDDLLIIAGDNLFDFNLNEFSWFGIGRHPYHSVCLHLPSNNPDLTLYGIARLNEEQQVIEFEEKPEHPKSNLIATCIYFFPAEKLHLVNEYISQGHHNDTPGSYIRWLSQHDRVYGKIFSGTWFDLGDFDSLSEAVIYLNGNSNHQEQLFADVLDNPINTNKLQKKCAE